MNTMCAVSGPLLAKQIRDMQLSSTRQLYRLPFSCEDVAFRQLPDMMARARLRASVEEALSLF